MFCKKCGTENKEGTTFCKKCGAKINEEPNNYEETTLCKKCGTENKEGTKFCKKCGNPLNTENTKKTVSSTNNKSNWPKTKRNKILAGVCAGLAEKWNINPWILRIILIVSNFFVIGWFLDIAYIILIFKLKYDEKDSFVNSNITSNVQTKISNILSQKEKIKKQRKDRTFEDEESKELSKNSESANSESTEASITSEPLVKEEYEELFNNSESAEKPFSPETLAEEEPEELFNYSEPTENSFSSKSDHEPSAEEESEELLSHTEPAEKTVPVNNAKKEKSNKVPRLSTIILAIILAVVVLAFGLFVFLYFNKGNNTDSEKKQSSIPAVTETSTEKETEVTTKETETEIETAEPTPVEKATESESNDDNGNDFESFLVDVINDVYYYEKPDYTSKITGQFTELTTYTVVDETYDETGTHWGKLKSGAGWFNITEATDEYYNQRLSAARRSFMQSPNMEYKMVGDVAFSYSPVIPYDEQEQIEDGYFKKINSLSVQHIGDNTYNLHITGEYQTDNEIRVQLCCIDIDNCFHTLNTYNIGEPVFNEGFDFNSTINVSNNTDIVYIEFNFV